MTRIVKMEKRVQYNFDILSEAIKRDNAILLKTYDKVTKRSIIYFRCHCGEESHKSCFHLISNTGALCKKCTKQRQIIKLHNTVNAICNTDSLNNKIQCDKAILLDRYDIITKNQKIRFRCNCGEESIKNCLQLIKISGAFCKKCTRITWNANTKKSNIERYGVEFASQSNKFREAVKQTLLKKYGVEHISHSAHFKELRKQSCLKKYGVEHPIQSSEIKEKTKNTCLIRYGVENPLLNDTIKEKAKQTLIKNYGVEYALQSDDIKDKVRHTIFKKYGVDYASQSDKVREKVKQTFIKNYGVDNPNKTPEIKEKIKQTNLKRYGVEYPSQLKEIMEKTQKNAKKYKEYTMPSGIIRKVQGYESFALDELVKIYSEDDIKTDRKDIPRIKYIINDKNKYYFPDIYIKSGNKIIEVKSNWTYKCKEDNVQEKSNATKLAGYEYEIWIYDNKGNKTILT
jgi:hypothetical protein